MMGPYFQQPRKKINQKAQGKNKLAGGGAYVPPTRHLVVKEVKFRQTITLQTNKEIGNLRSLSFAYKVSNQ